MKENFNLIDEPWIPVVDHGLVSLKQLFTNDEYRALGGSTIEKMALTKFLHAIAQAAKTPKNEAEWQHLGSDGLALACLHYLEKWRDNFYFYGEKPFLQFPQIKAAALKSFSSLKPDVATGNATCLTQYHVEKALTDAQKALLLLTQMGFALSGKKTDNRVVLSEGYTGKSNDKGKPSSAKPGSSVAHMGLLHSFATGCNLQQTIWINVFTQEEIAEIGSFCEGVGRAPWEKMPEGENSPVAQSLKQSLMGRLIPLGRFCLFTPEGVHLTEGIHHLSHKEGIFDPSITTKVDKEVKVIWCNPERRPWRELPALLSFIASREKSGSCLQLKYSLKKAYLRLEQFGVWSGGLRVSSNAGEQYVSGRDDSLESHLLLSKDCMGESWFESYTNQLSYLENLAKRLYGCVNRYFKTMKKDGKDLAASASNQFWQLCERDAQKLIDCWDDNEAIKKLQKRFYRHMLNCFDNFCPNQTARQLDAWAESRPNTAKNSKQKV